MKFCPQCGNQLKEGQHFCSKCGNDLQAFEDYRNDERYNYYQTQKPKRKVWPFVLVAIVVIGLIVASCFTYYHFFIQESEHVQNKPTTTQHVNNDDDHTKEHRISNDPKKTEQQREDDNEEKDKQSNLPKIDVLSDDFFQTYMQKNNLDGYMGFKKGMTKDEVEKRYGKGTPFPHIEGFHNDYIKYGNIAITYNPHTQIKKVAMVAVAPDNVSEHEFISKYNNYDKHSLSGSYIYNNVKDNGFEIIVTPVNGKVVLIECVPEY
ncbi:zinc-ribbon domain-containing protein [Staphylococcus taiwanensis]|nr:zinc-ribbon domain-containing protein [Staphylococcus taiwanensis]